MRIAMSSGHCIKCQGMDDIINEVEEATRVVDRTAEILREMGHDCETFHDLTSSDSSDQSQQNRELAQQSRARHRLQCSLQRQRSHVIADGH